MGTYLFSLKIEKLRVFFRLYRQVRRYEATPVVYHEEMSTKLIILEPVTSLMYSLSLYSGTG